MLRSNPGHGGVFEEPPNIQVELQLASGLTAYEQEALAMLLRKLLLSFEKAVGQLGSRHYHRRRCDVSVADCVAAEVARSRGEALATSDPHLLDVCHAEGIVVIVLPGSTGSRWTPPQP